MSRKKSFPLPRSNQILHTKFFKKEVESGALCGYMIVWVGTPLKCRFRSNDIKNTIEAKHVFILQKDKDFEYALVDSTASFHKLPKKFYQACFPSITVGSVPRNNLIRVKVTKSETMSLPYIPDSFFQSKQNKTMRKKRKITTQTTDNTVENVDFKRDYPLWTLVKEDDEQSNFKSELIVLIRNIIREMDENNHLTFPNPFESGTVDGIKSTAAELMKLKTIISFIYHYCRGEFGCFPEHRKSTSEWLESMKNAS